MSVIDWQAVIAQIKADHERRYGKKLSNYKLGKSVGLDHSQIEWLETHPGSEPRHSAGMKLLAIRDQVWDVSHVCPQFAMQSA